MKFKQIDIENDKKQVINFRKDSFIISFGDHSNFDEDEYLEWLEDKVKKFPDGFVLIEEDGRYIGQVELNVRECEGKNIGYVNLYYLIPEIRGMGRGKELHNYAYRFFIKNNIDEYHLRVSPTNTSALKFYRKLGMREAGLEVDGKVNRMIGYL